jgi:hypothetical protein
MLDCITAFSTLATAVVAVLVYFITKRQFAISAPVIDFQTPGNSLNDYRDLAVFIAPPDDRKFRLEKLVVVSPSSARIAEKVSNTETNSPEPADWHQELSIDRVTPSTGVFFTGPRGSSIEISVHVCLRSDVKVKSRSAITINMND